MLAEIKPCCFAPCCPFASTACDEVDEMQQPCEMCIKRMILVGNTFVRSTVNQVC